MKIAVDWPDPEVAFRELTTGLMQAEVDAEELTVGIGLPASWTKMDDPPSVPHVQIEWRVTPRWIKSVAMWGTMQVIVHANSLADSKRIALRLWGLYQGPVSHPDIAGIDVHTGPLPARDPRTLAEVVSFDVGVGVRAIPVDPGS